MQTARDKNIINVKSTIPAVAKIWTSLFHLSLCIFIWLFFSSSVDAFEISAPTEEEYVGRPIIYQDVRRGAQVASLLTKEGSEYQYLFVYPLAEGITESWIRFKFGNDDKGNPVALETELLSRSVSIVAKNNPIEIFRYPLCDDDKWEQNIGDVEFTLSDASFKNQTVKFLTTVKEEEKINVPAGSFETLHVATQAEWIIYGVPFSLYQDTWLDEKSLIIKRSFQLYLGGNPLEDYIMELLLPPISNEPYLVTIPDHGDPTGGTEITIVGDALTEETKVRIGTKEIPKEEVKFNEDTKLLTTWTPPIEGYIQSGEKFVQVITDTNGKELVGQFIYILPFRISRVIPNRGNASKETSIFIEGNGFEPKSKVWLSDKWISSEFINSNLIIAYVPKLEPGAQIGFRDVIVVNPDEEKRTFQNGFEYIIPLSIEKIEPFGGPLEGGTVITITGTGFNKNTAVTIETTPLVDKDVHGTTIIKGKTPPAPSSKEGWQKVIVSNDGLQVVISEGFHYGPPPTIKKIEPIGGDLKGGTDITITGTGFWGEVIVTIGGRNASNIQVQSPTQVTVKTPTGNLGPQQVVVTNPDGQSSSDEITFTYNSPPYIDSISPPSGKLTGGTKITITGKDFIEQIIDQRIKVELGETAAREVQFISETQLTATTPARTEPGDVLVVVTNPDGQQVLGQFTYNPLPTIASISPPSGRLAGGTSISITGGNFIYTIPGVEAKLKVTIGEIVAKSVQFISNSKLSVTTPEHSDPGTVEVIITNPDGQQAKTTFTYNPFPTITDISPLSGNPNVVTPITITGENFIDRIPGMPNRIQVLIDGTQLEDENIQFLSSSKLRIYMPKSQPGTAHIVVTNPDGQLSQENVEYIYNFPPKVTTISPGSGTAGANITLTGENFIKEIVDKFIGVTVGGITVDKDKIEFVDSTKIQFPAPESQQFGAVPIIVTNPDEQSSPPAVTFTYNPKPTVRSISPGSGRLAGGTKITIEGIGFVEKIGERRIQVKFEEISVPDADVKFVSSEKLIVSVPKSNQPGEISVIITNPDGQQAKGTYTYNPLPTITGISPHSGKLAGGTKITITGTGFINQIPGAKETLTVTIGGVDAEAVQFASETQLTVTTPARSEPGEVLVIVTNPDGQQAEGTFTYNPLPKVSSVSPPSGKLAGGMQITITGDNFIEDIPGVKEKLTITIDGVEVEIVEPISKTQLTSIVPARAESGKVVVIITNPDGQQAETSFTYNPLPKVTSISPPSGKLAGGTKITITGDNFIKEIPGVKEKLTITIDGVEAQDLQFISVNQLTVTTSAHTESGDVVVLVTNPDGQQAETTFTYNPFPTVTEISPTNGNPNVITSVTITGENFIERIFGMPNRIQVHVGNIQISDADIQFLSSNELRIFTPKSQPGTAYIVVTNPDGQSSQEDIAYVYNSPPKVTDISPKSGTVGTKITLKGENFISKILDKSLTVTIGGTPVDVIEPPKSDEIQFIAPDIELLGPAPIIVINPDGQQTETIVSFTYIPGPTVRKITPSSGRLSGGTKITIDGTGFVEKIGEQRIQVEFEGISVLPDADVGFVSPDKLRVSTPESESPDMVYVIVTNPDGQSSEKSEDAMFTYNPPPQIESILPKSGKLAGGTTLVINGERFIRTIPGEERELTVTIGGTSATSVWFVSAQELRITTPARARPKPGEVAVIVTNPDGQQAEGTFTYNAIPTITKISPPSGKLAGETKINIAGTGFIEEIPGGEEKLTVMIGGIAAKEVNFSSSTQLTVTTPGHYNPGTVDIIVTNPDGQQAKGTFTYNPIPTITSISPTRGKLAGGTDITISGTGFIQEIPGVEAKLTITIGGIEAPITPVSQVAEQMQFISANQLTVTTPKSDKPGEVDVIVTNPDGQQAKGKYNYNPLPTVTDISPGSGKLAGGTKITITGTGFIEQILDKHLSIQFGDVTTKIESILPTQIVLTTPASAGPKAVDVIITNPDEQQTSTKFTYNPFPTVNSITPDRGTAGTQVTISGSNFIEQILDQSVRLKVGNVSVEKINFVSSKEITFIAPAHEIGSFPIIVINPDGQESQQVINFTYNSAPTITDILPPRGRMDGGTEVTIRGAGFMCEEIPSLGKIQVKIGDKSVEINGCSPTELNFITPPNSDPGDVDVIVINPDGQQAKGKFTYTSAPIVRSVKPKIGTPEGDTEITIKGENFIEDILGQAIKLTIGGREAKFVSRLSNTEIIARTPPAATPNSVVDVIVIGPDGQRSSEYKFTYNDNLKISDISPNIGSPAGGSEVTISGTGFTEEMPFNVWFGDTEAEVIQVVSPTQLIIRTPPKVSESVVDVMIKNDDRQEFTLRNGFKYTDKLSVSKMSPKIGPVVGGTEVVINGEGFIEEIGGRKIEVTFGGKPGTIVSVEPTKLKVRTPGERDETSVEVVIMGPDGQKATLRDRFHYIDFPSGVLVYNYPNPTPVGKGTTFRFIDSNGNIEIKIFNMAGELVQSLPGNGGNTIPWDGKDRFGNVARFGLYPYVYLVDGVVKQGQLLHIRP